MNSWRPLVGGIRTNLPSSHQVAGCRSFKLLHGHGRAIPFLARILPLPSPTFTASVARAIPKINATGIREEKGRKQLAHPAVAVMASAESSSQPPMRAIDPQPIPSPSNIPYFQPPSGPQTYISQPGPGQFLSSHPAPESYMPNQLEPGSTANNPTIPGRTLTPTALPVSVDVHNLKANAQFHLREYLGVRQKIRQGGDGSQAVYTLESRLRTEAGMVLGELSTLQAEVRALAKSAQDSRWSRFFVGGAMYVSSFLLRDLLWGVFFFNQIN